MIKLAVRMGRISSSVYTSPDLDGPRKGRRGSLRYGKLEEIPYASECAEISLGNKLNFELEGLRLGFSAGRHRSRQGTEKGTSAAACMPIPMATVRQTF